MASWALSIQAHGVLIQWRMGWQTGSRRTMGCWECESIEVWISPRLLSPQTNRSLPHFWSAPLDIHLSSQPTVYVTEVSVHERSTATNLYSSGCFCNMSNYCCTACKLSNSRRCHVLVLMNFLNSIAQQLINVRHSVFEFCLQMSIHWK